MTRSELYALVWQEPMTKLAKRFRLSDVGLRKICTKCGIPTPPLGYWAKLAHGKQVTQPARAKHREKFVIELAEDYARYRRLADFADVFDTLTAGGGDTQAGRMAGTLRALVEEAASRFTIEQLSSEIDKKKFFGEGDWEDGAPMAHSKPHL